MLTNKVLPGIFREFRQSSTILHIKDYHDNFNGVSNYSLVFNIKYINAVKRSLIKIGTIKTSSYTEEAVLEELKESILKTLNGNSSKKNDETYSQIYNKNKELIKGVKYHDAGERIHLFGLILNKTIIKPARYPIQSTLAKTKMELRNKLPMHKFRQFVLTKDRFQSIKLEQKIFTPTDLEKVLA